MPSHFTSASSVPLQDEGLVNEVSQRLNGIITPGLVHEMNNLLTGIYFNLETIRELFDASHIATESLNEINQSVERIKELLGRTAQVHLNAAEREINYHDLEVLVSSQLDLLRLLYPRTFKVTVTPPARPVHVHVAEFPFRVALLSAGLVARQLAREPKSAICLSIYTPENLETLLPASLRFPNPGVAVGISIPAGAAPLSAIDSAADTAMLGNVTLASASSIMHGLGGALYLLEEQHGKPAQVLLVLPEVEINL